MKSRCLILALVLCTGCSDTLTWQAVETMITARFPDVREISTDSLQAAMLRDSLHASVILDVRTEDEYRVSHVPGAIRIDPDHPDFTPYLELDADTPFYTYCSVGYRSAKIADELQEKGFRNVSNVMGALFRWANESRPLVRADTSVFEVHPYDSMWGDLLREDYRAFFPGETRVTSGRQ